MLHPEDVQRLQPIILWTISHFLKGRLARSRILVQIQLSVSIKHAPGCYFIPCFCEGMDFGVPFSHFCQHQLSLVFLMCLSVPGPVPGRRI